MLEAMPSKFESAVVSMAIEVTIEAAKGNTVGALRRKEKRDAVVGKEED